MIFCFAGREGAQCGMKVISGPGPLTLLSLVEETTGITGSDSWGRGHGEPQLLCADEDFFI